MEMKLVLATLCLWCAVLGSIAAPYQSPDRPKRVSDQRLAELETLLALSKMKNRKYVTLPVGMGLIDVHQIGRRKRGLNVPLTDFLNRETTDFSQSDLKFVSDLLNSLPEQNHFYKATPSIGEWKIDESQPETARQAFGV